MLFMVIEHFDQARVKDVYARFQQRGRMAPDGVRYVESWISADLGRCFQVMECDDRNGFCNGATSSASRSCRSRHRRRQPRS